MALSLFSKTRVPLGVDDDPDAAPVDDSPILPDRVPRPDALLAPKAPITASPAPAATPKTPIQTKYDQDQSELQRLQKSGSGISQLTHPVDAQGNPDTSKQPGFGKKLLAGLARVGDIAGTAMFPGITAQIPGTELHHRVLENQQVGRVMNDLGQQKEMAQTANLQAMPEIRQAQLDLKQEHEDSLQNQAAQKLKASLAQHGFKQDEQGNIVALPYDEMSEEQQAVHDLKTSQAELADARTAYAKAQKDNMPLAMQMAQQRIATAQQNASIAAGKLGLQRQEFERDTFGTNNGQAIPGGPKDKQGNPVGFKAAKTDALTNSTRTMVEAAPKVREFVTRINQLIDEQQKSLGPAASRWSEYMAGKIGAPNPEFTKLRTDVGLLQTLLMRMHVGSRGGEYIMKHFHDLLDSSKQSPENLRAALGEIDAYAKEVAAAGGGGSQSEGGEAVEEYIRDPKTGKLVKK